MAAAGAGPVRRVDQQPVNTVADEVGRPVVVGGDERRARAPRFEEHDPEGLAAAGDDDDVAAAGTSAATCSGAREPAASPRRPAPRRSTCATRAGLLTPSRPVGRRAPGR